MKICYYVNGLKSIIERAVCYINRAPAYEHVFVRCSDWGWDFVNDINLNDVIAEMQSRSIRVSWVDEENVETIGPHIAINASDQYFRQRLNHAGGPNIPNLVDKAELATQCRYFGIPIPDTVDNADDLVFIKPRISSGAYCVEDFGYKKFTLSEAQLIRKAFPGFDKKFIIQRYLDSTECVLFIVQCNGSKIELIDSCTNIFSTDANERPICVFGDFTVDTFNKNRIKYKHEYNAVINMLNALGYNKVIGTFNFQFSIENGIAFLHDFNTRTGPFSVGIEKAGLFELQYFNAMEYYLGKQRAPFNPNAKVSWSHHMEQNGIPVIQHDLLNTPYLKKLQLNEAKQSGMVRSDYDTIIHLYI